MRIKAYVLLESLVATALFAFLVSLVLTQIRSSHQRQLYYLDQEELYQAAQMAVQTGKDQLKINGHSLELSRSAKELIVYHEGEVLFAIEEK